MPAIARVAVGNSSQRKAKGVRARSSIRRLMYGRLKKRRGRKVAARVILGLTRGWANGVWRVTPSDREPDEIDRQGTFLLLTSM
jgi:hypothetical protein